MNSSVGVYALESSEAVSRNFNSYAALTIAIGPKEPKRGRRQGERAIITQNFSE